MQYGSIRRCLQSFEMYFIVGVVLLCGCPACCDDGNNWHRYHSYSCRFGNFLGDTDKVRSGLRLDRSTPCIWIYMSHPSRRKRFVNAFYDPKARPRALLPASRHVAQSVQLWCDYFLRWIQYPTMELEEDDGNEGEGGGVGGVAVTVTQQFRKFDALNVTMHDREGRDYQ